MLNYRLLIICICIVVALTVYLFFWNRLVGYVLGRIFRLLFRNQGESRIWLDIGSIHFSLLAGRILFKDLRYHSSNQTIRVVKGQLSWRYWIRAPAGEDDLNHARIMGEDTGLKINKKTALSCRLHMSLQGLEWFIYNRTAAYDNIVNAMESSVSAAESNPGARSSMEGRGSLHQIFSWSSAVPDTVYVGPPVSLISSIVTWTPSVVKKSLAWGRGQLPNFDPKELLPISLEIAKAAIVIGNPATPTLLVAEFQRCRGSYGVVASRSKYDLYKHVLNLDFEKASLCYVDNSNHKESMSLTGKKIHNEINRSQPHLRSFSYLSFYPFDQLWQRLKLWSIFSRPTRPFPFTVHGAIANPASWNRRRARKALDDETPLGADFSAMEYAKETKVLEAPKLELLYYADAVGQVPEQPEGSASTDPSSDPFDIGNGDLPPEWGIDIVIRGGVLRYGPWADRQRGLLQQALFPPNFAEITPHVRLKPGDTRMWTCMKMLVELRDGVTLQIPFREASKNWQWDGEVEIPNRPRKREAASIHIKAGDNSTISYMMPMVATYRGYEPSLNVHLDTVTVTSSLNDIRLITANSCVVRCELPSPLQWNGQRQWTFTITLRRPVLYLLRDHINMFTDLGKDWATGPPTNYNRFVPMEYVVDIHMENYELNTYVNDHNIIDKPLLLEENALLTLRGMRLQNHVEIPFTKFRPASIPISFWIELPDIAVCLTLPKWNTRNLYSRGHRNSDIGRIGFFRLDATYCYHADVHPENVDQLTLEFTTRDVVYKMCSWTIRHFMILRNNYFGSFTHFSTLYEYLEKRKLGQPLGDPVDLQYREGSSNPLQVIMNVSIDSGLIIMPAGLRGYEGDHLSADVEDSDIGTCTMLSVPELQLYLRTHNYYMEMSLNIDTVYGTFHTQCSENLKLARATQARAKESFVVDGLNVLAHRLFGPQPHTTTYLCLWEIHAGSVKASLGTWEARVLQAVGRAFGMNFTDPLNAPAAEYEIPSYPDVTFLKVTLDSLNVVWRADAAAAELSLPSGLRIDTNDLPGQSYSKVQSIRIPQIVARILLADNSGSATWYEASELVADACIDLYSAPSRWRETAKIKREFLAVQDSHTGRAMFMYMPDQSVPYDALAPGRGFLDTEFYLPQIRIPQASRSTSSSATRNNSPQPARPRITQITVHRALRRVKAQSDSEGEERISDADRDARLAKSRPVNVLPMQQDDEGSISSGDESDDGDITEPDHTDSEFVASPASAASQPPWHALHEYRRVARCYIPHLINRPAWWTTSPYIMRRGRAYKLENRFSPREPHLLSADRLPSWTENAATFDDQVDTSVIRVASKRAISLWFTPLVISAMASFLRDLQAAQLSPELRLDGMIIDHIQSSTIQRQPEAKSFVFDIGLASLHIATAQSVRQVMRDAAQGASDIPGALDVSTVDAMLENLHLKWSKPSGKSPNFLLSFTEWVSGIGTTCAFDEACHLSLGECAVSIDGENMSGCIASILAETQDSAIEHLLATATNTLRCAEQISTMTSGYTEFSAGTDLRLILQTIKLARDRTIVDALSTTQPSYLIQSGRSHQLRTDALFKYLVHLRASYQYLDIPARDQLSSWDGTTTDLVMIEDITQLVASQVIQFGADAEDVAARIAILPPDSPLKTLFGTADAATDQQLISQGSTPRALSFKLARMHTTLHSKSARSEFSVEPLTLSFCMAATDHLPAQAISGVKSTTTLTLTERTRRELRHAGVIICVGDVLVSVNPELIKYIQTILQISGRYKSLSLPHHSTASAAPTSTSEPPYTTTPEAATPPMYYADVILTTRSLRLKAGAENLIIEYKVSGVDYSSALLVKPATHARSSLGLSLNQSLIFTEVRLQACAVADITKPNEYGVLAALIFSGGRVNVIIRQDSDTAPTIRTVFDVHGLQLNVPRSALRLYRFMEEWRADYLPGLEGTVRSLISELERVRHNDVPSSSPPKAKQPSPTIHVEASLRTFRVSLQVMRGTWVAWEIAQIIAYTTTGDTTRKTASQAFGMSIGSQTFIISSKAHSTDAIPNVRVRLPLPTFSFKGKLDGHRIDSIAMIEFFSMTVKPSHWDTILSVQQKFGQDSNDLLSIIADNRHKKPASPRAPQNNPWKYRIVGRMKGFSIGLDGVSSTLFLACDHVEGAVSNEIEFVWKAEMADLALSLAPRTEKVLTDSHNRSAFVIIDANAEMGGSPRGRSKKLNLNVTKIHAVMQASSIGEIGDFVDHLQAEILIRKEQRAQDLADFREKTRKFMRTFEMKSNAVQGETLSFLDRYTISVAVQNVGVAFPLALSDDLRVPQAGGVVGAPVRAFLFSLKSINFGTDRGETGQAAMKNFSFQFVSRFRQNVPSDFSGEAQPTRNRLLYPEMTAQIRSERSAGSRQLHVAANVDGFVLDIDSSIPDYIASVIEVYRQGKERVDRLAGAVPRTTPTTEVPPEAEKRATEEEYSVLLTSNMFLSLTFRSGKVRMFSEAYSHAPRTRAISTPVQEISDEQLRELGAEVFNLPVVSVWGEYRATPALTKVDGKRRKPEPSTLVFKSTVHSSQNTLRPSLLPFLTEVVDHVEERMRKIGGNEMRSSFLAPPVSIAPSIQTTESTEQATMPTSSMQISLSLRIDQSKLELTCQPDVNVVAGVHWDSGGFVVNISPGAHRVTLSGSVGGLTVGLKHGFLSEDCMRLHARDLAFTVDFAKTPGQNISTVSVVCDTEFSGGVRFSRLQDILCFKAVWLDRIPVFNAPAVTPGSIKVRAAGQFTPGSYQRKQELNTTVLIRIRRLGLDIDLGQSISLIQLSLSNAVSRTRMVESMSEVSLSVHEVSAVASGHLAGHLGVPDFMFQTVRRTDRRLKTSAQSTMLDLRMTSGPLEVELESEYQKLLLYRAEPLHVRISDDWSTFSSSTPYDERRVRLTFTVEGTDVVAIMNVGTVPKLVSYGAKFKSNLDAQKEGASRESQAFRVSNSPKPENALSEVANAMFSSARSKFMEAESGFSCMIGQRLSLKLKTLRLVIFPRSMRDPELAQFTGYEIHAKLDRAVKSEALPPVRDLQLVFSSIAISKLTQLQHGAIARETLSGQQLDTNRWLALLTRDAGEATIFSLPSTDIRMHSDEFVLPGDGSRYLPYDFTSKFIGKNGKGKDMEDIYITLNMSLYAWLTILRKTFAREMDQVRASAEVRPPTLGLVQPNIIQRRKHLEPLAIPGEDGLRVESPEPMSPVSRRGTLQHTKSLPAQHANRPRGSDGFDSPKSAQSTTSTGTDRLTSPSHTLRAIDDAGLESASPPLPLAKQAAGLTYQPRQRHIERLTMRQLGEATPDVMHPFFMKTAGFNLEDALPQYVHEYATMPTEEIMKALLKLYNKQLNGDSVASPNH